MPDGIRHNADQVAAEFAAMRPQMETMLRGVGRYANARIVGHAVGKYLRDAKGEGPREESDSGPLRILSGRYLRALNASPDARAGSREGFSTITATANRMTLEKGATLIYAGVHEYGATIRAKNKPYLVFMTAAGLRRAKSVTIPARPVYEPALDDAAPEVEREGGRRLFALLQGGRILGGRA